MFTCSNSRCSLNMKRVQHPLLSGPIPPLPISAPSASPSSLRTSSIPIVPVSTTRSPHTRAALAAVVMLSLLSVLPRRCQIGTTKGAPVLQHQGASCPAPCDSVGTKAVQGQVNHRGTSRCPEMQLGAASHDGQGGTLGGASTPGSGGGRGVRAGDTKEPRRDAALLKGR